jgi:hypothetical protein
MRITIGLLLFAITKWGFSQGCSDAGFCTMGAMKPDQNYSKRIAIKLRSLEVNYYKGQSLLTPVIRATTIDFNIGVNDKNGLQVKLPYQWIEGSLGKNEGLGDISLSWTHLLKVTNKWNINGTIGAKIPTNNANSTVNNQHTGGLDAPIHMYYQTSLGSYDGIAGISMIGRKWLFATGIQVAFTESKNKFLWSGFPNYPNPNNPDNTYVRKYNVAHDLRRGVDLMLRAERNWRFTNFNFSLGALPIFRVTKDQGYVPSEGVRKKLEGTTGVALSVLASFGYQFDVNHSIKIIEGHKLLDRDFNPDGLTRKSVTSISYVYKF